jgi:hypothetical protein
MQVSRHLEGPHPPLSVFGWDEFDSRHLQIRAQIFAVQRTVDPQSFALDQNPSEA